MCMVVYKASDAPHPLVPWNERYPSFHVQELDEVGEGVRKQFFKPYVYYVGAHEGCGCGFSYGQHLSVDKEDEKDLVAARESVRQLSDYLANAVRDGVTIELYACWSGDEKETPEHRAWLKPGQIGGETFWFEERQLAVIGLEDGSWNGA